MFRLQQLDAATQARCANGSSDCRNCSISFLSLQFTTPISTPQHQYDDVGSVSCACARAEDGIACTGSSDLISGFLFLLDSLASEFYITSLLPANAISDL